MTIPNVPPDEEYPEAPERREPSPNLPPDGPTPETPPEYPQNDEPGWKAPGSSEDQDAPMRMPGENPDVETEL